MGGSHFFRAGQYPKGGIQALLQPQHVVEPQQPSAGDTLRELQQLVDSMPDDEPTEPGAVRPSDGRGPSLHAPGEDGLDDSFEKDDD